MKKTKICELLKIELPIIQAGMVWVSGGKLAAASANAGCLGVIGAGSMKPDLLKEHILKAKTLTNKPLAINLPIMYKDTPKQIETALELGIKIFITSAGSPKLYTQELKDKGCIVIHVTSSLKLAKKCEEAGVHAIIIEGFEAGGHNGRDELTTLVLLQQLKGKLKIPIIAAGGFGTGESIAAAICLGANGVQMGTRFMMTKESSAHENYKNLLIDPNKNETMLSLKKHVPVRLIKNKFFEDVKTLEENCASKEELVTLLGKGRAKAGMLEGDLEEGELEAGQICNSLTDLPTVAEMVKKLKFEYETACKVIR